MKIIASLALSNWGGLEIVELNDEYVSMRFNFGSPSRVHRRKSYTNAKGVYFKINGRRYYLNDFMVVSQ